MFFVTKLLKFRPNVLCSCVASSVVVHAGILGTVFFSKIASHNTLAPAGDIPIDWVTIAPEKEINLVSQAHQGNRPLSSSTALDRIFDRLVNPESDQGSHSNLNPIQDKIEDRLEDQAWDTLSSEIKENSENNSTSRSSTSTNLTRVVPNPNPSTHSENSNLTESNLAESNLTESDVTDIPHKNSSNHSAPSYTSHRSGTSGAGIGTAKTGQPSEGKPGTSSQSSGDRSGLGSVQTPAPTPMPTPPPTPVPTPPPAPPPPAPEVFECVACPRPAYPAQARRSGYSGSVQVIVDVAPSGAIVSASLGSSSGSPDLDQAAIDTVQTWQFTTTADGRWGVPVYVDFELVE